MLGAILLTGYLGGAVASNVRAGTPLFNVVFPLIFACLGLGRPMVARQAIGTITALGHHQSLAGCGKRHSPLLSPNPESPARA